MADDNTELSFITFNEHGERMDCDTLFTFEAVESSNNIIVYTDNTQGETGNIRVYASIYDPNELGITETGEIAKLTLAPIEDQNDWAAVNEILIGMAQMTADTEDNKEYSDNESNKVTLPENNEYDVINVHYPE